MEITTTAKIQIIPENPELLIDTMHVCARACDYISEYVFNNHDTKKYSVQRAIYYDVRGKFGLPSQITISCIRNVTAKYKTMLSNGHGWNQATFRPQLELVWNRDYSIINDRFSVNTIDGRIKAKYHSKGVCLDGKFGTAHLVYKHGKFFLYVPVTREVPDVTLKDIVNIVGVDRGIRFSAVTYDNNGKTVFFSGNDIKTKRAHYATLRKELQSVGTPSSRRRLKAIGNRENRFVQDANHCISKALVLSQPSGTLFVLEDLTNIRKATERVHVKDRYVNVSWPYYDLEQKIIYKAHMNGSEVVKVNPAYTSQTCPKCGHTEKTNRNQKKHIFHCKSCGYESNDDRIAAMNLHRMGIEYLMQS